MMTKLWNYNEYNPLMAEYPWHCIWNIYKIVAVFKGDSINNVHPISPCVDVTIYR